MRNISDARHRGSRRTREIKSSLIHAMCVLSVCVERRTIKQSHRGKVNANRVPKTQTPQPSAVPLS